MVDHYILRDIHVRLEKVLLNNQNIAETYLIEGAKQVGKTSLIYKIYNTLPHLFIDLAKDRSLVHEIDRCKSFREFQDVLVIKQGFVPNTDSPLILDNAHECKNIGSYIAEAKTHWPKQRIILITSLSQKIIKKQQKPPDNFTKFLVTPFSFLEFVKAIDDNYLFDALSEWDISKPFSDVMHNKALSVLETYLNVGGLPNVVKCFIEGRDWHELFTQYLFDYLDEYKRIHGEKHADLFESCLSRISQTLGEPSKMTHMVSSHNSNYFQLPKLLDFLEELHLVYKIPLKSPEKTNSKRIPPRRFVFDLGFRDHFSPSSQQLMFHLSSMNKTTRGELHGLIENYILCELKSRGVRETISWRQKLNGSSVSFLVKAGKQIVPLDTKVSLKTNKKFFQSLINCMNQLKLKKGVLFSADKGGVYNFENKTILQVPLYCVFKL